MSRISIPLHPMRVLGEPWSLVPRERAAAVPRGFWELLGPEALGPESVATLVSEAGPERFDGRGPDESERDIVVRDLPVPGVPTHGPCCV